MKNWRTVTIVS